MRLHLVAALTLSLGLLACGNDSNAPADHTVSMDGVKHKPGLQNPQQNCTACHGASLGGGKGPSCTSCHGVLW